jgi:hypothetical protein
VVDRRLRCCLRITDRIRGIVGVEDVVSARQKGFLHEAVRFDTHAWL